MTCCVGRQTCYAHLPAPRSCITAGSQSVFPSTGAHPPCARKGYPLPVTLGGSPSAGYESADFPGCSSPPQWPTPHPVSGTPPRPGIKPANSGSRSVPGCGLDLPSDPRGAVLQWAAFFPSLRILHRPGADPSGIRNYNVAGADGTRAGRRCGEFARTPGSRNGGLQGEGCVCLV